MDKKLYKCKFCGERKPLSEIQVRMPYVCRACIPLYFEENKDKVLKKAASDVQKKERQRLNKKKEELMTLSDWLKIAQTHFNAFVRERDKDFPCITCGEFRKHNDAGHFLTVGSHPELRFNEDAVHKQCVWCNRHKHGDAVNYAINLPKRIGQERFDALLAQRNTPKQYTIPEVKDLIELYKGKLRDLKKNSR